jgi:hypothetical protein
MGFDSRSLTPGAARGDTAMNRVSKILLAGGAALLAVPLALVLPDDTGRAADHLDPPSRTDAAVDSTPDKPADIADVYAWHTATSLIVAVTFAGPQSKTFAANYDRDVLYTINISTALPRSTPEFVITARFGADPTGPNSKFGVQFAGIPGVTGTIEGPVETNLTKDGVTARAGLVDDPFFFDLQGFRTTQSTGNLAILNTRDFFAGQNDTMIIVEIPRDRLGTNAVDIWATTARFGGNI